MSGSIEIRTPTTCDCCGDPVATEDAIAQYDHDEVYCAGCLADGCHLDGLDDPA